MKLQETHLSLNAAMAVVEEAIKEAAGVIAVVEVAIKAAAVVIAAVEEAIKAAAGVIAGVGAESHHTPVVEHGHQREVVYINHPAEDSVPQLVNAP